MTTPFEKLLKSGEVEEASMAKRIGGGTIDEVARNKAPVQGRMNKAVACHESRFAPVNKDLADRMLSDLSLMDTLNQLLPGFYPGAAAFHPAMKSFKSGKTKLRSPWPVQRNLFVYSDLTQVSEFVSLARSPWDAIPVDMLEDYRPIDDPIPMIEGDAPLFDDEVDELESDGGMDSSDSVDEGLPYYYHLLGYRLLGTKDSQSVITLGLAAGGISIDAVAATIDHTMTPVKNTDNIVVAHISTLPRLEARLKEPGAIEQSYVAWEIGRVLTTAIGYSDRLVDTRVWTDGEADQLRSLRDRFLTPFVSAAITGMLCPAYFDYQIEQVPSGPDAEAGFAQRSSKSLAGGRDPSPQGESHQTHKPYCLIRAVTPPKQASPNQTKDDESAGSRREPEAQVDDDGFWRHLRPTSVGQTKDGNPIMGKTWVGRHRRWLSKPEPLPRLKEPLGPYLGDGHRT